MIKEQQVSRSLHAPQKQQWSKTRDRQTDETLRPARYREVTAGIWELTWRALHKLPQPVRQSKGGKAQKEQGTGHSWRSACKEACGGLAAMASSDSQCVRDD